MLKRNKYYQSKEVKEFQCKSCGVKSSMSPNYKFVCVNCAEFIMKRDDEYAGDNFLEDEYNI